MTTHKTFDLMRSPLTGVHLIEASAGTGKTYTITGLVVRLVEAGIPIHEILVVTFTEAATAELKERIRSRMEESLRSLEEARVDSGEGTLPTGETVLPRQLFAEGGTTLSGECRLGVHRLRTALNDFDQASIFTIHGFCQRVLREHAFESGTLLDMELVTDQESFVAEVVQDFWREHFYSASSLFIGYAMAQNLSPQALRETLREGLHHPWVKVVPQVEPPRTEELEKAYLECFDQLQEAWRKGRPEVERILCESEGLNRNKYRPTSVPAWILEMDELVDSGGRDVVLPQSFARFTASAIAEARKPKKSSPDHPFFHVCERFSQADRALAEAFDRQILALKVRLLTRLHEELARRKEDRQVFYFDDLLLRVHAALHAGQGESLVGTLRRKFKAALIDEFQDTDSIQYDIFQKIFDHPEGTLFLIGDPKQAIYGFRGADIFAYMKASRAVTSRFTLHENWRSEPHAIDGVNALFEQVHRPFVYDEIPFFPVSAAKEKKQEPLLVNGRREAPVRIWVMRPREGAEEKKIPKTSAREDILRGVALEIVRLLEGGRQGKITLGERPLREGDLAVLVRANREASALQEKLARMNVHSVLYSTGSLFDTDESFHMEWLLRGLANPSDGRLVKRALVSLFFGLRGEDILGLEEDGAAWDDWLVKFHAHHEAWKKQGFFVMLRKLLNDEQVLVRLMGEVLGERKCTNVLHLAEVLHRASVERKLGMFELIKWLALQRRDETPRLDEHQLRLESDEDAVKLVTIHRSKGLEYPVVFCPFIWSPSTADRKKPALFHDTREDMQLTLDLGSPSLAQSLPLKEKELLAENLRLLYVAVTRARSRCTLVWGGFNQAETSAPSYLFHYEPVRRLSRAKSDVRGEELSGIPASLPDDLVAHMAESLKGLSHAQLLTDLEELQDRAAHAIAVEDLPTEGSERLLRGDVETNELTCRVFTGSIGRDWRISSFSSLVLGEPKRAELQDYDELVEGEKGEGAEREGVGMGGPEERTIFTFPRGAGAGTFVHEIFEEYPFSEKDNLVLGDLVRRKLREHGFEDSWAEVIEKMVRNVLHCPLEGRGGSFVLHDVAEDRRLNELEFYFPLRHLDEARLEEILSPVFERKTVPLGGMGGERGAFGVERQRDTALGSEGGGREGVGSHGLESPGWEGEGHEDRRWQGLHEGAEGGHSSGRSWKERLRLEPLSGFMKGFIDLVFEHEGRYYIVDWKSNHLGDRPEDYGPAALTRSMDEHLYTLQYHLYTVAVHRYLKQRLPDYDYEAHFGGVYYLFLRGIDPGRDSRWGVFQDRPPREIVQALCAGLLGEGGPQW